VQSLNPDMIQNWHVSTETTDNYNILSSLSKHE